MKSRRQTPPISVSAIEHEEGFYRLALDASSDWLEWLGPNRRHYFISPACLTITGYRPDEFLENPALLIEITHPDDRHRVAAHYHDILDPNLLACELEFRIIHRAGETRWIHHICQPMFHGKEWTGRFATNRDITQRKHDEEALRQNYQILNSLLNAPSDLAVVLDMDGRVLMVNDTLARLLKHSVDELHGQIIWDYFSPQSAKFRKEVMQKAVQTKLPQRVEDTTGPGPYDSIVLPIFDPFGEVTQVAILARDISERLKTEQALQQREALIQSILNNAPVFLFAYNQKGDLTFADGKILRFDPKLQDELIGKNIFQVQEPVHPVLRGMLVALSGQMNATQYTTPQGKILDLRFTPLIDPVGKVVGAVGTGVDNTELYRTQEELQSSKEELEIILEGVADGIAVTNSEGELVYANQIGLQLGGYFSLSQLGEEFTRQGFPKILDEMGNPIYWDSKIAQEILRGTSSSSIIIGLEPLDRDEVRWIVVNSKPILDDSGKPRMVVFISHDITELKKSQAEMEHTQLELERRIAERTTALNLANQELVEKVAEHQRVAAQAEALARVAARFNAQTGLYSALQAIFTETSQSVNYPICAVYLYDEEKDELQLAAPQPRLNPAINVPATPRSLYEQYLHAHGSAIIIPDCQASTEQHGAEMIAQLNLRTLVSLPLIHNEELIGCLNVGSIKEIRLPAPDELTFLHALADQASIAISKARLFDQVSESHKKFQQLSEKLVAIQEIERRDLARELHDEIGQTLTSLRLNLELAARAIPISASNCTEAQEHLMHANETASQLLEKIREMSLDLRPALLDDLGLLPALLAFFQRFTEQTNIQVEFKHTGLEGRFPSEIETTAYRFIQEALTNVVRHAGINEVMVRIWANPEMLGLQVQDHGVGFDLETLQISHPTSGLSGMKERVATCGGQFEVESEPGKGTHLSVELPL